MNKWYEAVEQEHNSTVKVLKAYVHCSPLYQQETTFTTRAGARRPGGAMLDQVHWAREANIQKLSLPKTKTNNDYNFYKTGSFESHNIHRRFNLSSYLEWLNNFSTVLGRNKYLTINVPIVRAFQ